MGIKIGTRTVEETDFEFAVRHDDGAVTICDDEAEADFLMSLGASAKLGRDVMFFGWAEMP